MSSGTPLVSILMNCYNGEKYLRNAIDSIYAQTYQNWEIIFIDNCSIDKSAEIAKSYTDGKLKYHTTEENIPLYAARKFGLQFVSGDFLGFLDVDDWWLPQKLEEQLLKVSVDEEVGFVYSNSVFFYEDLKIKRLLSAKIQPSGYIFKEQLANYKIDIENVLLKTSILRSMDDTFDLNLNLAGDFDLFLRMLMTTKAAYVDEPLSVYRLHGANLSTQRQVQFQDEKIYVMEKLKRTVARENQEIHEIIENNIATFGKNKIVALIDAGRFKEAYTLMNSGEYTLTWRLSRYIGMLIPPLVTSFLKKAKLYIKYVVLQRNQYKH